MVDELWTIISESFSHCCPMATQGVWKLKNSKATNLEVVWQGRYKPRQLPCDLFLSVTFLLFLFFPVGSIRSMKEAKCTCLGAAVIWNPIPSLGTLTKTFPCAAFFMGANYCWEKAALAVGSITGPQATSINGQSTGLHAQWTWLVSFLLCASEPWLLRSEPLVCTIWAGRQPLALTPLHKVPLVMSQAIPILCSSALQYVPSISTHTRSCDDSSLWEVETSLGLESDGGQNATQ